MCCWAGEEMWEKNIRLDKRKTFLLNEGKSQRVKPWFRLSREVVGAPALESFKVRLDGTLSDLIWLKMSQIELCGL